MTLDDLVESMTVDEVRASIYEILAALGVNTTNWKPGAVTRTVIAACAIVISALSRLVALIARSGFLELAEGDWLTLVARFVYGVERITATFATGSVTLNNSGGGVYGPFAARTVTFVNGVTGKTYRNTAPFSIGALQTGVTVAVEAIEAGSASSAVAGEINALQTALPGVSVTNPAAVVGSDAETDPNLRLRCQEKLGALSPNGPPDAYAHVARSAVRQDGSSIGVTRVRVVKDGLGGVDVYCATDTGGITGDANDINTDLGAVNDAIQRQAVPLAVTARVHSATTVGIPVTYQAWIYNNSGLTAAQILEAVEDELLTFFASQPVGGNVIDPAPGKLFKSAVQAVVLRTHRPNTTPPQQLGIFAATVTLPAADVTLSISDVPVAGAITGTITQVPVPTGSV